MDWAERMEPQWTSAQKRAARTAFDAAYARECRGIRAKVIEMLQDDRDVRQIWRLHDYLSEQRRATDRKYDYRYSRLIFVFAVLLREGWLNEAELAGLGEEKLARIKSASSFD